MPVYVHVDHPDGRVLVDTGMTETQRRFSRRSSGLAADGKVNANGMPNPLQMSVLARAYRREMQLPPPQGWILGAVALGLSPIGRLLGYRVRYERYSGPRARDTEPQPGAAAR